MSALEKAIETLREFGELVEADEAAAELARLRAAVEAAREVLDDIKDNWYIEKLQPGDVAESDVSVDNILALAAALERAK